MIRSVVSQLITLVVFFLLLFGFFKLFGPLPLSINSVTTTKSELFTVTGTGEVETQPNTATLHAGVVATGPTVESAQNQMNEVINKVSSSIKGAGIDSDSIKTQNFSINPNYDFNGGTQKITGYTANSTLEIKVKDITKVNQVIDLATQNGANQVGNVSFDVSDKQKLENEAREKAVADAKQKAQQASQTAGFRLGKVVSYTENSSQPPVPRPLLESTKATAADTQIEPGTNTISIIVTLGYEVY